MRYRRAYSLVQGHGLWLKGEYQRHGLVGFRAQACPDAALPPTSRSAPSPFGRGPGAYSLPNHIKLRMSPATKAAVRLSRGDWKKLCVSPTSITWPDRISQDTLAGDQARVTAIMDESSTAGQSAYMALQTIVARALGMAQTAELSAQAMEQQQPFANDTERQAYKEEAVQLAAQAWQQPSIILQADSAEARSFPRSGYRPGCRQRRSAGARGTGAA